MLFDFVKLLSSYLDISFGPTFRWFLLSDIHIAYDHVFKYGYFRSDLCKGQRCSLSEHIHQYLIVNLSQTVD